MKWNVDSMKYEWQDGTYSVYRKWCAGQPIVGGGECVVATDEFGNGCWETIDCTDDTPRVICDISDGKCKDDKESLMKLVTVAKQELTATSSNCKTCRKH